LLARRIPEVPAAMLAITHARAIPAIDKNPVDVIARHDLALDLGHEVEVVGTQAARDPHLRRGPMPSWRPVRGDGDPIRMRGARVLIRRMRVGAGDHDETELATAGDQFAEHIPLPQPLAAMMERNRCWIIGDAAAGTQADSVGTGAFEVIQPEAGVELAGIILHQG